MIAALLAALQLAVTQPALSSTAPGQLVVKDASRSLTVALVATPDGPILRADQLRPIVPLTVSHVVAERWMIILGPTAIEVQPGVRLAKVGAESYQLSGAPELRKGALYVPLQLVVEIIPRVANNLIWDPARFELRAFSGTARPLDSVTEHRMDTVARRVTAAAPHADTGVARQNTSVEVAAATRETPGPSPREASSPREAPSPRETPSTHETAPPRDAPLPRVASSKKSTSGLRTRRLVVVDAGHGGPDAGMHGPIGGGPQLAEKMVTLDVAKRVGAALGRRGVDVLYTRTTDTLIALSDRGRIANDAHADLFVSIHVNAANPGWKDPAAARGFETYFLAEAKTEDARRVEQMENEVVKFEATSSAHAGDPLSFILNDMAQNEHLRESNELAELIQRRLSSVHPGPSRGVKQAGFRVLVTAFMPAVLVEIGFGTNADDAAYITNPAKADEIAASIAEAVREYLRRYERRVASSPAVPSTRPTAAGGLEPR